MGVAASGLGPISYVSILSKDWYLYLLGLILFLFFAYRPSLCLSDSPDPPYVTKIMPVCMISIEEVRKWAVGEEDKTAAVRYESKSE